MKNTVLLFLLSALLVTGGKLFSQISINTDGSDPDASAMLDVKSSSSGVLIPRMTGTEREVISSPATGLMVFVTDDASFYFYNGSTWDKVGSSAGHWIETGTNIYAANSGNVGIGTNTPNQKLDINGSIQLRNNNGILHDQSSNNYLKFVGNNDTKLSGGAYLRLQIGGVDRGFINSSIFEISNDLIADGLVGIGTSSPEADLHVVGAMKFEDGNQGAGKVLVSDANGVSSWADPNDALAVPDTTQPVPIRYHGSYIYVYPEDNATDVDWTTAQSTCDGLIAFGYDDWFLPDKLELNAMYKQSFLITGLEENSTYKYWSDTEMDAANAFTQRLDYGGPDPDDKTSTTGHSCRCIRKN